MTGCLSSKPNPIPTLNRGGNGGGCLQTRSTKSESVAVQVDDRGCLSALPQLVDDYCPDLDHLPAFVLSMAQDVNWDDEQSCFRDLAQVGCPAWRKICRIIG